MEETDRDRGQREEHLAGNGAYAPETAGAGTLTNELHYNTIENN